MFNLSERRYVIIISSAAVAILPLWTRVLSAAIQGGSRYSQIELNSVFGALDPSYTWYRHVISVWISYVGNEKHINRRSGSRRNVLETNDASLDFQFAMFVDKSLTDFHIKIQSQ